MDNYMLYDCTGELGNDYTLYVLSIVVFQYRRVASKFKICPAVILYYAKSKLKTESKVKLKSTKCGRLNHCQCVFVFAWV